MEYGIKGTFSDVKGPDFSLKICLWSSKFQGYVYCPFNCCDNNKKCFLRYKDTHFGWLYVSSGAFWCLSLATVQVWCFLSFPLYSVGIWSACWNIHKTILERYSLTVAAWTSTWGHTLEKDLSNVTHAETHSQLEAFQHEASHWRKTFQLWYILISTKGAYVRDHRTAPYKCDVCKDAINIWERGIIRTEDRPYKCDLHMNAYKIRDRGIILKNIVFQVWIVHECN